MAIEDVMLTSAIVSQDGTDRQLRVELILSDAHLADGGDYSIVVDVPVVGDENSPRLPELYREALQTARNALDAQIQRLPRSRGQGGT